MNNQEIIKIGDTVLPVELLGISKQQQELIKKSIGRIADTSSRLEMVEREIANLHRKIQENPLQEQFKKLKQQRKILNKIQHDSTNVLNGVMEAVLINVQGESLMEKYENLKQIGGRNGRERLE